MIPTKLTLQGIYSYQKKQVIDFEKLTSAGLFGIFGTVGSGKSTILEAISFALYGETERLNKSDNRNYNMMNLKSNELLIDFEFKTGNNKLYRFTVKGKRNSKKFDDIKTLERAAYEMKDDVWFPIDVKNAESITGLNYDNFRRTIIIPQNKFQEFLQLNAKDRTVMLQELFKLNKFELSGKISSLENKNNAVIQNITGQIQTLGEIKIEDIEAKEKELAEMLEKLTVLNKETAEKEILLRDFEQLKDLCNKTKLMKDKFEELQKEDNLIKQLEIQLVEYEKYLSLFKLDFESLHKLEMSHNKLESDLKAIKENLDIKQKKATDSDQKFKQTRENYEQKDLLIQKIEDLNKILNIKHLDTNNKILASRCENGRKMLDERVNSLKINKEKLSTLALLIEEKRKILPDITVLSAVQNWFTNRKHFCLALSDAEAIAAKLKKELLTEKEKTILLAKQQYDNLILTDNYIEEIRQPIESDLDEINNKLSQINNALNQCSLKHKLQEFAHNLEAGKPCPLCGSPEHPNIIDIQDIDNELNSLHKEQQTLIEKQKQLLLLEKTIAVQYASISSLHKQNNDAQSNLDKAMHKLNEHLSKFIWNEFSANNEDQLNEAFLLQNKLSEEIENLVKQQSNLQLIIEKDEVEKEKYTKALNKLESDSAVNASQMELLVNQLQHIKYEDFENINESEIKIQSENLQIQYNEIITRYQTEENELKQLYANINSLRGSIQTCESLLIETNNDIKNLNNQINTKLTSIGNIERQYVTDILNKNLDIETIRKKINSFKQNYETIRIQLQELEKELNGRIYEENAHTQLKEQLNILTNLITSLNQKVGIYKSDIQHLKSDLDSYTKLQSEKEKLELRAKDIAEMKALFRGNAFVNFVSTVYLENLCKVANNRFYKLTRQRLSLELAPDNNFLVRDFMNEGKLRNIKTLSGGQTFQASLSLALALANNVHQLAGNQENFFFLDEGFGSLDKDSLNIVFDALKSLRKENRIVGVISHVEEMQQEIETYLNIENQEDNGSIISTCWE
jgi:exonuclease SbcC